MCEFSASSYSATVLQYKVIIISLIKKLKNTMFYFGLTYWSCDNFSVDVGINFCTQNFKTYFEFQIIFFFFIYKWIKFRSSFYLPGVYWHAALWTKDNENLHLLKNSDFEVRLDGEGLDMYRGWQIPLPDALGKCFHWSGWCFDCAY